MRLRDPCGHVPNSWRSSLPAASALPDGTAVVRPLLGCRGSSRRIPADGYGAGLFIVNLNTEKGVIKSGRHPMLIQYFNVDFFILSVLDAKSDSKTKR